MTSNAARLALTAFYANRALLRSSAPTLIRKHVCTSAAVTLPRRYTPATKWTAENEAFEDDLEEDIEAQRSEEADNDWYIDKNYSLAEALASKTQSVKKIVLPPQHLPEPLLHFYTSVLESPFFDDLIVIDAKKIDPASAYCDYIFIAQLKSGRERSIRGASQEVKRQLAKALRSSGALEPNAVLAIEGLANIDEPRWAVIDADSVVAHVMTKQARAEYSIESIWREARSGSGDNEVLELLGSRQRAEEDDEDKPSSKASESSTDSTIGASTRQ